jgi:hypothetical protein
MKKFLIIIFLLSSVAAGQNPNLGTSGAQFLEIPVGARAAALGGAFVGLSDDAASVFWNPAGLTRIKNNSAHFTYMNWFDFFDFNAASAAFSIDDVGTVAASFTILKMDRQEITTEQQPNGTGRFYDAQDIALGISFARYFTDRFSFGITLKYVQQRIWNETASGLAFDVGTQYRIDFQNLVIAMSMKNFGADIRFEGEDLIVTHDISENYPKNRLTKARLETEDFPLPLNFQVGIAFDIYKGELLKVLAAVDAVHPNDNRERVNFGTEISVFDRIFFRGGYKYNYDDVAYTVGAGANLPIASTKISFNYAYSIYDILPSVHRISLDIDF